MIGSRRILAIALISIYFIFLFGFYTFPLQICESCIRFCTQNSSESLKLFLEFRKNKISDYRDPFIRNNKAFALNKISSILNHYKIFQSEPECVDKVIRNPSHADNFYHVRQLLLCG